MGISLTEKAMMLKNILMMQAKMEKFDDIMPDALAEYIGEQTWYTKSFFFRVVGFPQDTYYSFGYDKEDSFCDDFLHDIISEWLYLVNLDAEEDNDYRAGNENDPSLPVFEEKVLQLENMAQEHAKKGAR